MLAEIVAMLITYFIQLKVTLKIWWIRVNKSSAPIPKSTSQLHKIIVAGDGFAEGYGDWVTFGHEAGIVTYMHPMIVHKKSIRSKWILYNRGQYATHTDDWLPSIQNGLFSQTFDMPSLKDAEVVILLLGSMDGRNEVLNKTSIEHVAQKSNGHLRAICSELSARGKHVFVSKVWDAGEEGNLLKLAQRKNELLDAYLKKNTDGSIKEGPALTDYRFKDNEYYSSDMMHFCSKGYKHLASLAFEAIHQTMTKVEFDSVKDQIYAKTSRRDSVVGPRAAVDHGDDNVVSAVDAGSVNSLTNLKPSKK
eukprot:CFRG4823T1